MRYRPGELVARMMDDARINKHEAREALRHLMDTRQAGLDWKGNIVWPLDEEED